MKTIALTGATVFFLLLGFAGALLLISPGLYTRFSQRFLMRDGVSAAREMSKSQSRLLGSVFLLATAFFIHTLWKRLTEDSNASLPGSQFSGHVSAFAVVTPAVICLSSVIVLVRPEIFARWMESNADIRGIPRTQVIRDVRILFSGVLLVGIFALTLAAIRFLS